MTAQAQTTTDHDTIRRWAEERDGKPASVTATRSEGDPGILRIDFEEEEKDEALEEISWDEFFHKFEENRLAFLYQEESRGGGTSRFFKFVRRSDSGKDAGD